MAVTHRTISPVLGVLTVTQCLVPGGASRVGESCAHLDRGFWCAVSRVAKAFEPATLSWHGLRKLGLVRPKKGVTGCWSLVTSLSETRTSESVLVDSAWLHFAGPLLEELARGLRMEKVWPFDYAEYFHSCCRELKVSVVP